MIVRCEPQPAVSVQASRSTDRSIESYVVDGRTNEEPLLHHRYLQVANARAKDEPIHVWDIFDADLERMFPTGQRHPLLRTGERAPIPWARRLAVLVRDGGRCQVCGIYSRYGLQLDHVVPWSAGGSDRTENLRAVCEPCNMARSNYDDGAERKRYQPCTWWCLSCWSASDDTWTWDDDADHVIPSFRRASWWTDHPRLTPDTATVFAFCAHCGQSGWTDVTF